MKIVLIVHSENQTPRLLEFMRSCEIDAYTRWEKVKGKGHQTRAHNGRYGAPLNEVTLIAFEQESRLERLVDRIERENQSCLIEDEKMHLFQMPLERFV